MVKKFKYSLLLVVALGTTNCSEHPSEVDVLPDSVIPGDSLSKILVDFTLSEGMTSLNINNIKLHKFDSAYPFNPLHTYQVSKMRFDTSIAYYGRHPDVFKLIYNDVLLKLSEMQSKGQKALDEK